ncbi:hypothetical protein FIM25_15070 [Desulfobotulus mexicanus]|uniref:Uncharacterized protein n=2 Tax=Desulfobotulus mexicanus TaxID=2586642 RepID=A0A5S5MCL4_9BACT|nr:hypothetical protein FIM25_15070 [Desulfobotulus mexicanus]
MAAMSSDFQKPYGEKDPDEESVARWLELQMQILDSLDEVEKAVLRIDEAKSSVKKSYAFARDPMGVRLPARGADGSRESKSLRAAWDFLVNGLGFSAQRGRERVLNVLDQISDQGKQEAYEYALKSRGIMNRKDVEGNAEAFWQSFREGKYDNQANVLFNDLTSPSATIVDGIEFADVAERGSVNGRSDIDSFLKEGADLTEKGRNFNPSIDGNILMDEIEDMVASEMEKELHKYAGKHKDYLENVHGNDPEKAADEFVKSIDERLPGVLGDEEKNRIKQSLKRLHDAVISDDADSAQMTVMDATAEKDSTSIIIAEGKDDEGNPLIYVSDKKKTGAGGEEGVTMTLPEGSWIVDAVNIQGVIDSVIAAVKSGMETILAVDTSSEKDDGTTIDGQGWKVSRSLVGSSQGIMTWQVIVQVSDGDFPLQVKVDPVQGVTSAESKTLSGPGTLSFEVRVTSDGGYARVSRSDDNESVLISLPGETLETYVLNLSAAPASPPEGVSVTVTASISPAHEGVEIGFRVVGTDGYTDSETVKTDSSGQARIFIPGADSGVRDTITATVLRTGYSRSFSYTFVGKP